MRRYAPIAATVGLGVLFLIGCIVYAVIADRICPIEAVAQVEHPRWLTKFFCDAKAADFAIIFLTLCLVLVTGWLVRATVGLQEVTAILTKHVPIVERAYVFGGAGHPVVKGVADPMRLVVTINNYGKTPTFIGTVAIGTCPREHLGKPRTWEKYEWKGYALPAPSQLVSDVDCEYKAGDVVIGRIWYRDIFNQCHSTGFALHMNQGKGLPAVPGHDEYWQEREEKDLGPAEPSRRAFEDERT